MPAGQNGMSIKLLCSGDFHLGRSPSQISGELGSPIQFSPREVLRRMVSLAKREQVQACLFTGDLVDEQNRLFEAYSALAEAVRTLTEAQIPVYLVAGNHDFDTLSTLANEIPGCTLLGSNGGWEEDIVHHGTTPLFRVQGRSFHSRYQPENPLDDYKPPQDNLPTLVMLHADVDAHSSLYAPVTLTQLLQQTAPVAWLLGHIHKPQILSGAPLILYPGSPQGLDPGEAGAHGPWLIELASDGRTSARQQYLAPLRYETIDCNIEGVTSAAEVRAKVLQTLNDWHQDNVIALEHTDAIAVRLVFTGRTSVLNILPSVARELQQGEIIEHQRLKYFIEKTVIAACPEVQLEQLSQQNDPPGLLARKLHILQTRQPHDQYQRLLQEGTNRLAVVQQERCFEALDNNQSPPEQTVRTLLLESGLLLLDQLLAQKQDAT